MARGSIEAARSPTTDNVLHASTMQNVLAIHESRLRGPVDAVLHYEPKILRGLTWSLLGYVALIAMVFDIKEIILSSLWSGRVEWPATLRDTLSGLFVLICAVVLTNIFSRGVPRPVTLTVAVVVGCALASLLSRWLLNVRTDSFGDFFFGMRINVLEWGLVVAAYYFIERSERRAAGLREAELERHRMEAQMLEAHLQAVQAQVEPHFLFNTLAHIQRLYQTDPTRGRSMLDNFCSYLRAALPQMRGSCSTLGREVELARAYLDTQRIRMGRRLRVDVTIPDDLLGASFPPMMLLSLVENAIKHGLNPMREGGNIGIAAESADGMLRVTVADTGAGLSKVELGGGDGVGLSNIRSRLATLYGGRAQLALRGNAPHGVVATVEIPLRTDSAAAADISASSSNVATDSRALGTAA